jgi:ABC-type glycerol-3-phosphate transport system permease component
MSKVMASDEMKWKRAAQRAERLMLASKIAMWIILLIGAVLFAMPFYLMLTTSFKSASEIAQTSNWALPQEWTLENYKTVLTNESAPFFLFLKNSVLVAFFSTAGVLLSSSLVAYAFARLKFRGRDRLFILLLSTMMLPGIVTTVPTYILFSELRWVDTILPLTVPAFFGGGAFNVFLLRQFFMSIPRELDEAAILDGGSNSTIFWKVIMPNSGAALATVGVFTFIYNWRDFMGPLIYLNSPEKQTLEVGLRTYQTLHQEHWDLIMAAAVIVVLPLIVLLIIGQRYFVKGIVMTGIK